MEEWGNVIGSFLGSGISAYSAKKKKKKEEESYDGDSGSDYLDSEEGSHRASLWESKPNPEKIAKVMRPVQAVPWNSFIKQSVPTSYVDYIL